MDLDSCGSDNFYDEIASFIPQSGDYSLDEIDEILRSTEAHLDTGLDLKTFDTTGTHNLNDFDIPMTDDIIQRPVVDFGFSFSNAFPSPTNTNDSALTPPYKSQRTSSISSMDEEQFNPDQFINFLNDDRIQMEDLNGDATMEMPQRNTPSPTGSCTSSSGSSTSGIQSDVSSVASMSQTAANSSLSSDSLENESLNVACADNASITVSAALTTVSPAIFTNNIINTTAQVIPVQIPTTATVVQTLSQVQPINMLIPVSTVPLTAVTTLTNIKAPAPIKIEAINPVKIEPKLAPKTVKIVQPPTTTTVTNKTLTSPPNSKPKTIFLSSNDFKALMQKMNTSGKNGAKITGGINGQMPKIIMKTANGKVVTANKIVQPHNANTTAAQTQQQATQNVVPKIVKAGGPLIIKHNQQQQQQHTKLTTQNALHNTATNSNTLTTATTMPRATPDFRKFKGLMDEKMFKKQQRMIKNRESASLSRKKKKEYVVSLETRINNLEKENYTLKGENTSLRSQLVAFAQTCQCKHSNVSEFILNSLNMSTKVNGGLTGVCNSSEHQHIKIAPKPMMSQKSIKQRMASASVKKNVAVLFAMAFMVTLNVGNFQTYFNKNSIENSVEMAEEPVANGRRLLWVETESEFKEKLNRTKRELEVPPLHFLQPVNRSAHNVAEEAAGIKRYRNSTTLADERENLRLASNLHKWIDGNDYLNLSMHRKYGNDLDNSVPFKLPSNYYDLKTFDLPLQGPGPELATKQKRKYYIEQQADYGNDNDNDNDHKQRKLDTRSNNNLNRHANGKGQFLNNGKNSLELFKPKISDEYLRLFKGIKRQDDTFYVLSFNMDHILLPASAYNKSARPKMSLMLPAGDPTLNGDIILMQIDCEVVNTTELELKSEMIPKKLRPHKYTNDTLHTPPKPNDVANNETTEAKIARNSMPFKAAATTTTNTTTATTTTTTTAATATRTTAQIVKEKPVVRTYFMLGPKNQARAATAATGAAGLETTNTTATTTTTNFKKGPIIVKINGRDGINAVTLNRKNSTLFTKMKETIGADVAP